MAGNKRKVLESLPKDRIDLSELNTIDTIKYPFDLLSFEMIKDRMEKIKAKYGNEYEDFHYALNVEIIPKREGYRGPFKDIWYDLVGHPIGENNE